jgi:hypothetical protein
MLRRSIIAVTLILAATSAAMAQSDYAPSASTSPDAAKTAPQNPAAMGAPAISKSKAEEKLTQDGYANLQLHDDAKGGWSGTATRNGATETLHVGYDGAVTKQ